MFGTNDYIYQELNLNPLDDFCPGEEPHDRYQQQMAQALQRQQQVAQMQPTLDYAALALQQQRMHQADMQRMHQQQLEQSRIGLADELSRLQRLRRQAEQEEAELVRIRERRRLAEQTRVARPLPRPAQVEAARQQLYADVYGTEPEADRVPDTIRPVEYDETFETLPWSGAAAPAPIEVGE